LRKIGDRVRIKMNAGGWAGELGVIVGGKPNRWQVVFHTEEPSEADYISTIEWRDNQFDLTLDEEYAEAVRVLGENYFA